MTLNPRSQATRTFQVWLKLNLSPHERAFCLSHCPVKYVIAKTNALFIDERCGSCGKAVGLTVYSKDANAI